MTSRLQSSPDLLVALARNLLKGFSIPVSHTIDFVETESNQFPKAFAPSVHLYFTGAYRVCLSDVNTKLGEKTCQDFRSQYGPQSVVFVACDVTSLEAVETLYAQAVAFFQTESIDLWVNNAGVMGEKEGWEKCLDINLSGVLNGLHVASAKAEAAQPLTVINVASILGLFNAKQPKGWAYNTSKSAVVTATRCMGPSWPYVRIVSLF